LGRQSTAHLTPIVDLNGDGIVDSADMCIIVDHWGTDEPLCDIGPTPFGNGIVDVQDLIVWAEHLGEEILPIGCIAYWKLDQTEGSIAHNSAGHNDGICHGEPLWQPTGGKIGGALQFDGIDDYVETDFVINPSSGGPFSVVAWIKGGSPGPPLVSESVINDGEWHHIGIVVLAFQSMQFRYLYLDGVRVAMDTQFVELPSSNGGMYFGTDKNLDAPSLFSGLIDDVRIYNKALSAEQIEALSQ